MHFYFSRASKFLSHPPIWWPSIWAPNNRPHYFLSFFPPFPTCAAAPSPTSRRSIPPPPAGAAPAPARRTSSGHPQAHPHPAPPLELQNGHSKIKKKRGSLSAACTPCVQGCCLALCFVLLLRAAGCLARPLCAAPCCLPDLREQAGACLACRVRVGRRRREAAPAAPASARSRAWARRGERSLFDVSITGWTHMSG